MKTTFIYRSNASEFKEVVAHLKDAQSKASEENKSRILFYVDKDFIPELKHTLARSAYVLSARRAGNWIFTEILKKS